MVCRGEPATIKDTWRLGAAAAASLKQYVTVKNLIVLQMGRFVVAANIVTIMKIL